jgi:hypothetical protein
MDIPALETQCDADAIRLEARRLGIESHLLDLHTYGVTIVPPEKMGTPELTERLRDAILRVMGERHGMEVPEDWKSFSGVWGGPQTWGYLFEDDAFVELALHPVNLCVARFLCGRSMVLQGTPSLIKTAAGTMDPRTKKYGGDGHLALHCDLPGAPSPIPEYAQLCNLSYLLSDYDGPEDGPTVMVPGSHRFGRIPRTDEAEWWKEGAPVEPISLYGKAGSLVVWPGTLWHGSRPRTKEGMRITLPYIYSRSYLEPIQPWHEMVKENDNAKMLEKFPELGELLGLWHPYPVDEDGPMGAKDPLHAEGNARMIGAGDNIYR